MSHRNPCRWIVVAVLLTVMGLFDGIHPVRAESDAWRLEARIIDRTAGSARLSRHASTGLVRFLDVQASGGFAVADGLAGVSDPGEAAARAFMSEYGPLFGVEDQARELEFTRSRQDGDGARIARFRQRLGGIPVVAGEFVVRSGESGAVFTVAGEAAPRPAREPAFALAPDTARGIAVKATARREGVEPEALTASEPEKWLYNPALLGAGGNLTFPVWRVEVLGGEYGRIRELVLVDAANGAVALVFNQNPDALERNVYDCDNDYQNCPLELTETDLQSSVTDAVNAFNHFGDAWDYYNSMHGRDSIDDTGMLIKGWVRVCPPGESCPFHNAFWSGGGKEIVFGEGYPVDDIVGHEYTHGVTQFESGLFYWMQSGAINESLSDIFGEFIDQWNGTGGDTAADRWLMGEDRGGYLRNMADPPDRGDPDRMGSTLYACGPLDNGGVHTNSGVGNKAAYLMTDGDTFNGKLVNGIGRQRTSILFYQAQRDYLTSGSDYADLADALESACDGRVGFISLYPFTTWTCNQVRVAVAAVEMRSQPTGCQAPEAPVCPGGPGSVRRQIWHDDFETMPYWAQSIYAGAATDIWTVGALGDAAGGVQALHGYAYHDVSDSAAVMSTYVNIPPDGFLHFEHSYDFERDEWDCFEGGILEYRVSGLLSAWQDAGPLFTHNGYPAWISSYAQDNPLGGDDAFVGSSNGWISSRVDLRKLAGKNVKFRFRIATDKTYSTATNHLGWHIDNVRIVECRLCKMPWLGLFLE